jgi:alkyl hydroperoxide reductase subunit D
MCIDAHESQLRKAGFSVEQIQAAVRIASTVQAAGAILDGEQAMQAGTTSDQQQVA